MSADMFFNLALNTTNPSNNYTFLPIYNHKYYEYYKKQLASFWTVEEIDLSKDRHQFNNLSEPERVFIKNILAFFAASDGIVAENLDLNFIEEISFKEVRTCLRFQSMMEDIHSEMYSRLIDTLITDENEKTRIFNAITTIPCIKLKAEWAQKWTQIQAKDRMDINNNTTTNFNLMLPMRLIAFACVEGIHFSGSFCAIYWLKKRNLMPGLTLSNEFIARDEGSHTETSISLYNDLKREYRVASSIVNNIIEEAVNIEIIFITESISCSMLGMNIELMKQYIKFVGDRLLIQLGYNKIWNVSNPFDFMENISVENKTNFFEDRVSNYSKAGVGSLAIDKEFDLDADF